MVYPNRVIENRNWTTNTGIDILLALGEDDGLYIYTQFLNDNFIELGTPSEVVNCELRVRADGIRTVLLIEFSLAGYFAGSATIRPTSDWITHTLTVDRWDSVLIGAEREEEGMGIVAVDFLRAEPYGGSPTKRTLTGVGV
jgi:hypothetical protein